MSRSWRESFEKSIDEVLKDAPKFERIFSDILVNLGIEPNLETVLSFLGGAIFAMYIAKFVLKGDISDTDVKEIKDFSDILKRRAWEIRQSMIQARIEENH